jgi:hypothetical protein
VCHELSHVGLCAALRSGDPGIGASDFVCVGRHRACGAAMSEMVERVSVKIAEKFQLLGYAWHEISRADYEAIARAAIGAMREPTDEMGDAGDEITGYPVSAVPSPTVWHAMIDEALK